MSVTVKKKVILDGQAMNRALVRVAHEIVERNKGADNVVPLAKRIAKEIEAIENVKLPVGSLDITLYRDDLSTLAYNPVIHGTEIDFDISGKTIVLVDDVLFTGRTTRCALDALIDMGRPKAIQLAVMIDRGHKELPVKADYVGKNVPTATSESVDVTLAESDGVDEVALSDIK